MKEEDGGSAFPIIEESPRGALFCASEGLTVLDYFAAHCPFTMTDYDNGILCSPVWTAEDKRNEDFTRLRYQYARAMLKERAKEAGK